VLNRFRGRPVGAAVLRPLLPAIITRYGLTALVPFERGGRWWVRASINPQMESASEAQPEGAAGRPAGGAADTRSPEEKRRALHQAVLEADRLLSSADNPESASAGLAAIQQRHGLRSLRVQRGARGLVIVGEINPVEQYPVAMSVDAAVRALGRGASEVAVRSLANAKEVVRRAFPEARESQGPTTSSAFPSAQQAALVRAFRASRGAELQFHVDVERFNVAAIRAWLTNELAAARRAVATGVRDLEAANRRYHASDRLGQREIQRLTAASGAASEKVRRLEDFDRDWGTRWEPQFRALERESHTFAGAGRPTTGVLLGHDPVTNNPRHRFIAHINVEGVRVADGSQVKAVVFIV
jgi:hypothetical protein